MVNKSLIIILFLLLNNVYNSLDVENTYSINLIDNDIFSSNYIIPVFNENDNFLYIVTGENFDDENPKNSDAFVWNILKFSVNSGILLENYNILSDYPFDNPEVISVGDNLNYFLSTTTNSLSLFNNNKLKELYYQFYSSKRFLKKIGSYYYHAYIDYKNKNELIIGKMTLINNNDNASIEIVKISEPIKALIFQNMVSCDFSKDNKFILCAYFGEDKYIKISIYNINLELIQTEQKENIENINDEYFIKIVWFKDNYKFIIINSKNDYITRLRYYKYINNKFISQLYTIIDNNNENQQYLDIDETQLNPYQNNNDIIAVDSDKIIKVYCYGDKIIISIFQFFDHDSLLFIKIYNMFNFEDIGFNSLTHPRLAMFKDSILVCLSIRYKNNNQNTGFFFIGYPNSIDTTLTNSNTIKIKDLISIENNIFSLNLKFKILEIPNDLIIVNSLDSKEIKEDDDFELDDELIIIQYRINKSYILKYEGVAIGNDIGFSSSKVYPVEKNIPPPSEIYIEGREGNITINLKNCLEGYHHIENDGDICTTIIPKEHYFDNNNNSYISCQSPCKECSGPIKNNIDMNCLTCQMNYYITEDTNSCYNELPYNYYFDDNKNTFRRCHERCRTCITSPDKNGSMNCLECEYDYIYISDTLNCLASDEYEIKKRNEFTKVTNGYFWSFTIILIISGILAFVCCCTSCCKEEIIRKIENEGNGKQEKKVELSNLKEPINDN